MILHPPQASVLVLKLVLVPVFLLLVTLAGRRWGPGAAGWLAGLPIVTGPILYFIAVERGPGFAAAASAGALSAVLASVSFSLAYAHACRRRGWPAAMVAGLAAWLAAAFVLSLSPPSVALSFVVALATLLLAPRVFPPTPERPAGRVVGRAELALRMLAGAALTLAVTVAAGALGPRWSGLFAVFPILGIVLAVFSHRAQGAGFAIALLKSMATGLYSFLAFCLVLAVALPALAMPLAFASAVLASLAVQGVTGRLLAAGR